MAQARLTALARADIKNIAAYTLRAWGATQADLYLDSIEAHLQKLANRPLLGRSCEHVAQGLRLSEHNKHVIFYRHAPHGINVSRILHQRMLVELHPIDDAL